MTDTDEPTRYLVTLQVESWGSEKDVADTISYRLSHEGLFPKAVRVKKRSA